MKSTGIALQLAVLLTLGCGDSPSATPHNGAPLSVILITMDTTRADHLGIYGYDGKTSPRLDAFAREASVFNHAISQAAVTPVSHASILTGQNPYRHGLRVMHGTEEYRLPEAQTTLAEMLSAEGYATGAFVSAFPVAPYFGFAQGFQQFDAEFQDAVDPEDLVSERGSVNTDKVQRRADETTDRAIAFMQSCKRPCFAWVHYFDPHDPGMLPPGGSAARGAKPGESERERRRRLYDFEIQYMDSQIGRFFDALKKMGLWNEALTIVTADHGEGLGDHGWWSHGILYQEQIHVPLLIRAPGVRQVGRVDALVRTIDIVPTVLDLLNVEEPERWGLGGSSLVGHMEGANETDSQWAYSDSVNTMAYRVARGIRDVKSEMLFALFMDGRWKYIHHSTAPDRSELYDLGEDPQEQVNLLKNNPAIVRKMRAELRERGVVPSQQLKRSPMPESVLERLRALGYAEAEAD